MKQDRRGSWYLLTGGVLGVAFGLFYAWLVSPVQYIDAPPYALRADFKNDYRALVAAAYLYSGDLIRAENRLDQLKDEHIVQSVAVQAQQAFAEGHSESEVKALSLLAMALARGPTATSGAGVPSQGEGGNTPPLAETSNPQLASLEGIEQALTTPSPIELAAINSTPAGFILADRILVCAPDQSNPQVQVIVEDSNGQGLSGIEVVVSWSEGEDHFFTGLKPELGMGFADFVMSPEVVYSLNIIPGGQSVDGLTAAQCLADDNTSYWGTWQLTFRQP